MCVSVCVCVCAARTTSNCGNNYILSFSLGNLGDRLYFSRIMYFSTLLKGPKIGQVAKTWST